MVYYCSSPTTASFSPDRHYPLSEHQRSTEYEEETEMNGLLCGSNQPEIIHHGEEGTEAAVQDNTDKITGGRNMWSISAQAKAGRTWSLSSSQTCSCS